MYRRLNPSKHFVGASSSVSSKFPVQGPQPIKRQKIFVAVQCFRADWSWIGGQAFYLWQWPRD